MALTHFVVVDRRDGVITQVGKLLDQRWNKACEFDGFDPAKDQLYISDSPVTCPRCLDLEKAAIVIGHVRGWKEA